MLEYFSAIAYGLLLNICLAIEGTTLKGLVLRSMKLKNRPTPKLRLMNSSTLLHIKNIYRRIGYLSLIFLIYLFIDSLRIVDRENIVLLGLNYCCQLCYLLGTSIARECNGIIYNL